jgi:hypothetical protein
MMVLLLRLLVISAIVNSLTTFLVPSRNVKLSSSRRRSIFASSFGINDRKQLTLTDNNRKNSVYNRFLQKKFGGSQNDLSTKTSPPTAIPAIPTRKNSKEKPKKIPLDKLNEGGKFRGCIVTVRK